MRILWRVLDRYGSKLNSPNNLMVHKPNARFNKNSLDHFEDERNMMDGSDLVLAKNVKKKKEK
jgi:nucleoside 2-deoxyribosyltransferase